MQLICIYTAVGLAVFFGWYLDLSIWQTALLPLFVYVPYRIVSNRFMHRHNPIVPKADSPEKLEMLEALSKLDTNRLRAFSLCSCERLHVLNDQRNLPDCYSNKRDWESPEVSRWREKTIDRLWTVLRTGQGILLSELLQESEAFVPKGDECWTCESQQLAEQTGHRVNEERFFPLLTLLQCWDTITPQQSREVATCNRYYIDTIADLDDTYFRDDSADTSERRSPHYSEHNLETHDGLRAYPLMRIEYDCEYSDLALLTRAENQAEAIDRLRHNAMHAWDSVDWTS